MLRKAIEDMGNKGIPIKGTSSKKWLMGHTTALNKEIFYCRVDRIFYKEACSSMIFNLLLVDAVGELHQPMLQDIIHRHANSIGYCVSFDAVGTGSFTRAARASDWTEITKSSG